MRYHYCTLFDANYLDKGIVTVNSIIQTGGKAVIYVLCMDSRTYSVLTDYYKNSSVRLISMKEFMNDELGQIKKERSRTEFCWSCSAYLIQYVLNTYKAECCTYIDADMFFYSDPGILVDEMYQHGCSVQIVEHRFKPGIRRRKQEKESGRFCVEFNSFRNDTNGRKVLDEWKRNIRRQCTMEPENGLGDQFYLNEWPDKYKCVHILKHLGAGIAPWNINRYRIVNGPGVSKKNFRVSFDGKGSYEAVFYHFHWMQYKAADQVHICIFGRYFKTDRKTVYWFYIPYIREIQAVRKELLQAGNPFCQKSKTMGNIRERFRPVKFTDLFSQAEWKLKEWIHGNSDLINLNMLETYDEK